MPRIKPPKEVNPEPQAPARSLDVIGGELQPLLKAETTNIIGIGKLLIEAKAQLEHGQWLPWLKANFGSDERTARNYMTAAKLAAKSESDSDLKLTDLKLKPGALYNLGDMEPKVIAAALDE